MKNEFLIDSVFLEFGNRSLLRGVSLRIPAHSVIGILGRNGSGKSSLFRVLTGHLKASNSYLAYAEQHITQLPQKQLINYLPQFVCHPGSMRVNDLLKCYDLEPAAWTSAYPSLAEMGNRKLVSFSYGEKRLIEVLLVLESKSKLSILDEPFTYLAPLHIEIIECSLQRAKQRKSVLLSDHIYDSVLQISDEVYLLNQGYLKVISDQKELKELGYIN